MRDIKSFEQECDLLMGELNNYDASPSEAQDLANKFLGMSYRVVGVIRDISNEIIMLDICEKGAYKSGFDSVDEKVNVTKAKALAQSNPKFLLAMKKKQEMENYKDYWKGVLDVFNNAHIFYRGLCRS